MTVKDQLHALCFLEARRAHLTQQIGDLRRDLLKTALDLYDEQEAAPTFRDRSGTASLVVPEPKPTIVDEPALVEWVGEEYGGDALELRVKPAWLERFWTLCQTVSSGAVVSPEGMQVPGVVVSERPPYLRVVLSKEARAAAEIDAIEEPVEEKA